MPSFKDLKRKLYNLLPRQRYKHSLSVEKTALDLARHYRVSKERVRIAALLHDCSRGMDRTALLKKAKRLKLKIDPIEEMEPKLLHSKISAYIARGSFGIKDKQILSAIKNHTVGVPSMSILDKIIYLSDKIEEKRTFAGVKRLRRISYKNMDHAIVEVADTVIKHLIDANLPIYPGTLNTRNYYLMKSYYGK